MPLACWLCWTLRPRIELAWLALAALELTGPELDVVASATTGADEPDEAAAATAATTWAGGGGGRGGPMGAGVMKEVVLVVAVGTPAAPFPVEAC